jgi:hypothetical protein
MNESKGKKGDDEKYHPSGSPIITRPRMCNTLLLTPVEDGIRSPRTEAFDFIIPQQRLEEGFKQSKKRKIDVLSATPLNNDKDINLMELLLSGVDRLPDAESEMMIEVD